VALRKACLGQIRYTGLFVDSPCQYLLCCGARYRQMVRFPIDVRTACSDDRSNQVPVADCSTQRFDVDRLDAFSATIIFYIYRETFARPIWTQYPLIRKASTITSQASRSAGEEVRSQYLSHMHFVHPEPTKLVPPNIADSQSPLVIAIHASLRATRKAEQAVKIVLRCKPS
jgi:hypothetical protein